MLLLVSPWWKLSKRSGGQGLPVTYRGFSSQSKQVPAQQSVLIAHVLIRSYCLHPKGRVNGNGDKCMFVNCVLNRLGANVTQNTSLCFLCTKWVGKTAQESLWLLTQKPQHVQFTCHKRDSQRSERKSKLCTGLTQSPESTACCTCESGASCCSAPYPAQGDRGKGDTGGGSLEGSGPKSRAGHWQKQVLECSRRRYR